MNIIQSIILGIIQGLTEFLPVSSSGHLEIFEYLMNIKIEEDVTFTVVVHGATVLSTIVVFWKDIISLFKGLFTFKWDDSNKYIAKIALSMIPVGIIGLFFKENVEQFFGGRINIVGGFLIITSILLAFTYFAKSSQKELSFGKAFIIGIAQAIAVLPGISRSGSTIATSLLLGVKKEEAAKFSFLMVLIPIIGANLKDVISGDISQSSLSFTVLAAGFISAFISGLIACKLMIKIVNSGKLIWFSIYCALVGIFGISYYYLNI